ncbi:type II toxin-antitoxin system HicA family toxin [bacterium]|nr:type II toxin-antitoxin system HicA family toxin [bacterium]
MPRLPVLSGRRAAAVFELGYSYLHHRGSHMVYRKAGAVKLSIPDHRTLDRGLLKRLIRDAGISVREFVKTLRDL